ncbi:MAG: hypothetical protein RSB90_11545 [Eubacterium sp.]
MNTEYQQSKNAMESMDEIAEYLKQLPEKERERALGFIFGLQAQCDSEVVDGEMEGTMKTAS